MKLRPEIIEDLLEAAGLEPYDRGKYYLIRCPECGHKESFLYKESNVMICNRKNKCGYTTGLYDYLKEENLLKDKEIVKSILNTDNEEVKEIDLVEKKIELPDGIKFFKNKEDSIFYRNALAYLLNRNLPEESVNKLGFILNPDSYFGKTIFIPFYENGEIVYFITRDYTGKRFIKDRDTGVMKLIRYINPKGVDSGRYVYNIDEIEENGDLFVFEGVMDALTLGKGQVGTASIKACLSEIQIIKIWNKMPGRIILVGDDDVAGRKGVDINYKNLMRLKPPSSNCKILFFDLDNMKGKDFNESGLDSITNKMLIKKEEKNIRSIKWQGFKF